MGRVLFHTVASNNTVALIHQYITALSVFDPPIRRLALEQLDLHALGSAPNHAYAGPNCFGSMVNSALGL